MNIFAMVKEALTAAAEAPDTSTADKDKHRDRSRRFVKNLAKLMRTSYPKDSGVCVLDKDCGDYETELGSRELLFDVLACRVGTVPSSIRGTALTYVTEGIWAVESEMDKSSREAVYDFNKLVLADCAEKLFVGPITDDVTSFIKTLAAPASACKVDVHLALITHPGDWKKTSLKVRCFIGRRGKWTEVHPK